MIDQNLPPVEIPERIKLLPTDKHGRPIPIIVQRTNDGTPAFAVNDTAVQRKCVTKKLCPICGQRLTKELWFVGGYLSAFHPHGMYVDSAMHYECMTFAMKTCPYLAAKNYASTMHKRVDALVPKLPTGTLVVDNTQDPRLPTVFIAVMATGQSVLPPIEFKNGSFRLRPLRPYLKVEFWRAGNQLSINDGLQALKAADPRLFKRLQSYILLALYKIPAAAIVLKGLAG